MVDKWGGIADMAESGTSINGLTVKQETAIAALLAGNSVQVSAKVSGVSERTLQRWLATPDFRTAYKASHREVFEQSLQKLMLSVDAAVSALTRNLDPENSPPYVQVQAANIILTHALNINQVNELEARVTELEAILSDLQRQ
jgi:hypothetical protein